MNANIPEDIYKRRRVVKKRLVAVILSLFMCTSMVSEAGAAAFTSPDAAVSDVETDTESIVTENTEESTDDVEAGDETEDLVSVFIRSRGR